MNLTWIHGLGERIVGRRRGSRNGERRERAGWRGNYFRFRALGIGYTFSPSCLPRRGRRRFLPPLSRPSPSLRDCSAGQGRPADDPGLAASSRSIGSTGDSLTDRPESLDFALPGGNPRFAEREAADSSTFGCRLEAPSFRYPDMLGYTR